MAPAMCTIQSPAVFGFPKLNMRHGNRAPRGWRDVVICLVYPGFSNFARVGPQLKTRLQKHRPAELSPKFRPSLRQLGSIPCGSNDEGLTKGVRPFF